MIWGGANNFRRHDTIEECVHESRVHQTGNWHTARLYQAVIRFDLPRIQAGYGYVDRIGSERVEGSDVRGNFFTSDVLEDVAIDFLAELVSH